MPSAEWHLLLERLSQLSLPVILVAFGLHLAAFFILWVWAKRDLRTIASCLYDFTRGLRHQSVLDSTSHLSDQIDAFLADVNDVLDDPTRQADRAALLDRMRILDEKRRYLDSMFFETAYNIARTMIEAYPLSGVLGTILAIGAALSRDAAEGTQQGINAIVSRFGEAIWSSFAGLMAAIVLMFVNSVVETGFSRLSENRRHVRETVARAKRELSLSAAAPREVDA
jgi:biopolymer transport protein ExbB